MHARSARTGQTRNGDIYYLNDPEGWQQAVDHDRAIRPGFKRMNSDVSTGELYLHRSLKPLDEVDLTDPHENQINLWAGECEGMCGV